MMEMPCTDVSRNELKIMGIYIMQDITYAKQQKYKNKLMNELMINQAKHIRFIFPVHVMFLKQLVELFDTGCY